MLFPCSCLCMSACVQARTRVCVYVYVRACVWERVCARVRGVYQPRLLQRQGKGNTTSLLSYFDEGNN